MCSACIFVLTWSKLCELIRSRSDYEVLVDIIIPINLRSSNLDSISEKLPCQHFPAFLPMFQRMEHPMIELDPDIRPMEPFACHVDHIYCRLTKTVWFRHFSRVEFVHCGKRKIELIIYKNKESSTIVFIAHLPKF